ncbi:MAG: ASPIC/UnbV domain-containing protein [Myxococcota bacterium]|nr:ASPIC/UnbV domain-containing protein [Myxococcota bacterium]
MVAHAAGTEGREERKAFDNRDDFKEAQAFEGSFSGYESNRLFLNRGGGRPFLEAGYVAGVAARTDGRATAAFDLEGDGRPDLAVLSLQDFRIYRNMIGPDAGQFVEFVLTDKHGGSAINAKVDVLVDGRRIVDQIRLTTGFHTQVLPRAHFGVGRAARIDEVQVRWPSGAKQSWRNLTPNQRYRLREGEAAVVKLNIPAWPDAVRPVAPATLTTALIVSNHQGDRIRMAPAGKPAIVNIWAPWCKPCQKEVPHLEQVHGTHAEWLNVVGLSAAPGNPAENEAFVKAHGLTYPNGVLTDEAAKVIFGADGELRLPTTLIFDNQGRLIRRFSRMVTQADLEGWIQNLKVGPSARDFARQRVILESQGDSGAALNALKSAAALAPKDVRPQVELARAALMLNENTLALSAVEAALRLSPANETVWQLYLDVLERVKTKESALRALERAPRTATLLIVRANLMASQGQPDAAIKLVREAIALKPDNISFKRQLADYLDKRERGFRPTKKTP